MLGLRASWRLSKLAPDPPGLEFVTGRNRKALRALVKLIVVLVDGRPGAKFFAGAKLLAGVLGCSHVAARKRLKALDEQGIIRQTWEGRLCRLDAAGNEYDRGRLVPRGSEFVFLGLPTLQRKV